MASNYAAMMKDTVSCSGKTALVTSAARGTGRAVAVALGKAGAQVLVHHTRSPAAADQTVSDIRASGGKAMALAVDLSSHDGPQELAPRTPTTNHGAFDDHHFGRNRC